MDPRVARIHLPNRGLNGVVPQRLSLLDRLEHLDLSNNSLGGPVPRFDTIGFDRLVTLYLGGNNLSGSFPDVSGLDSLQYLRLNDNALTGTPLHRLEYLETLVELDIRNNLLTGRVINFRYHSPCSRSFWSRATAMTGCYPSMLAGILLNDVETLGLGSLPGLVPRGRVGVMPAPDGREHDPWWEDFVHHFLAVRRELPPGFVVLAADLPGGGPRVFVCRSAPGFLDEPGGPQPDGPGWLGARPGGAGAG